MMPESMNSKRQSQSVQSSQSGMALFVVLLLLMVLATASVALIQNQRLAVRQIADRLDVLNEQAESNRVHEQCVATMRAALANPNTASWLGYAGRAEWALADDERWAGGRCMYEFYRLPAQQDTGAAWTPQVRVNSKVLIDGVSQQVVSEWVFAACVSSSTPIDGCVNTVVHQKDEVHGVVRDVSVQYDSRQPLRTSRQKL